MFGPVSFGKSILRKRYLDSLASKKNVLVLGPKFYGKTTLLKQYIASLKEKLGVYVDLEKISIAPESFAVEFVSKAASSFLNSYQKEDIEHLFSIRAKFGKSSEYVEKIHNELQKIKPDQKLLVESAFKFVDNLGKKVVLCLDELSELGKMDNFSQIKDFSKLFFNLDLKNVSIVAAGSDVNLLMEKYGKKMDVVSIDAFSEDEIKDMVNEDKVASEVYKYSRGVPYFAEVILSRYNEVKDVKKAFIIETLSSEGRIYSSCLSLLNSKLSKARGQTLLRSVLKVLSVEDLRLNEISRRVFRSSPVAKTLLNRLISVDLVEKKGNLFSYSNSILKYWAKHYFSGREFDEEMLKKMEEEL